MWSKSHWTFAQPLWFEIGANGRLFKLKRGKTSRRRQCSNSLGTGCSKWQFRLPPQILSVKSTAICRRTTKMPFQIETLLLYDLRVCHAKITLWMHFDWAITSCMANTNARGTRFRGGEADVLITRLDLRLRWCHYWLLRFGIDVRQTVCSRLWQKKSLSYKSDIDMKIVIENAI